MEYCLYDPDHGYYLQAQPIFGPRGDFLTSPTMHPVFGRCLGRALRSALDQVTPEGAVDLVELGPGDGALGRQLMTGWQSRRPDWARRVRYRAVDVGDWDQLPRDLVGVVFSNELFDALPVHRVRVVAGEVRELAVRAGAQGAPVEVERTPVSDRLLPALQRAFPVLQEGWVYEVPLAQTDMLARIDRHLDRGLVLTLDYGYDWDEYSSRPREDGTLLCFSGHRASTDPYVEVGRQDMTTQVHFDELQRGGERLGWRTRRFCRQREFLTDWGLEEELVREEAHGILATDRLQERVALGRLLEPEGISDRVRVLIQSVRLETKE